MSEFPVIAILRGVEPDNVLSVVECLLDEGISHIEVPLNSPDAFGSLTLLQQKLTNEITLGAGTVLTVQDVERLRQIGVSMCLTPNANPTVISACVDTNIQCIAGFTTPTEAFTCINSGTDWLKLFPASHFGPSYMKAIKAVIPSDTCVCAVGGIDDSNISEWVAAGVDGVGIGSWLYHPDYSLQQIRQNAKRLKASCVDSGVWSKA